MKDKLREYIKEQASGNHFSYCSHPFEDCCCKIPEITDELQLIAGGLLDSLSLVTIVVFIEKEWEINIKDTDITPNNFETINSIVELLKRYDL